MHPPHILLNPAVARPEADRTAVGQARQLLVALGAARAGCSPCGLSTAEDAVFRHYLPMARSLAVDGAGRSDDPEVAIEAAELGLARAVLDWRGSDPLAFEGFARATMLAHLRSFTGAHSLA
jgi:hypothetical protein